jgi:hypothetical protein
MSSFNRGKCVYSRSLAPSRPDECQWCGATGVKLTRSHDDAPDLCETCKRSHSRPTQLPTLSVPEERRELAAWFRELSFTELMRTPSVDDRGIGEWLGSETAHIETIPTGRRNGRPKTGISEAQFIDAIVYALSPRYSLAEMLEAARKRGPRNGSLPKLKEFARVIRACCEQEVNVSGLAGYLGLDRRRVYSLIADNTL